MATRQKTADKAYWMHRLPQGFQYYMEKLARTCIRVQPADIYLFAAQFLEGKQTERQEELLHVPEVTYLRKLIAKKSVKSRSQQYMSKTQAFSKFYFHFLHK
ncbi:hypothetical protein SNE40_017130 [Patella caerulea]|uniref:RIIa domain-containing protein n=1 Tax=Patella caerulea TaxID=87958 RepID=A0AAN8JD96_PATCE